MRTLLLTLAFSLAACSSAPEKKAEVVPPPPAPVKDHRVLLLAENQTSASIVPDHILGNKTLPGGSLGEYDYQGRKYQLFIVEAPSAQDAAFIMLDFKGTLKDPAYIAYMGGYFGAPSNVPDEKPVYIFAKGKYLAGVVGLNQPMADPIARQLAARL